MQRELTQTRDELQKGVLEMPAEAIEASSAMRRAIAEQIEAINELSKIVARSAGETMPPPPPRVLPCRWRALRRCRRVRPGRGAGQAPPQPAPPRRPPHPRPSLSAGRRRRAGRREDGGAEGCAGTRRLPTAPRLRPSRARGNGEARGWVADLLRRASSDEPAKPKTQPEVAEIAAAAKRSPAQVVESLNSLSIDIARAIDHEASVELWDRYKRGERNVFTRRLYTLQGQKTFDELRRKYERDTDFRRAVDNYIGDFERLLSQVSKDDSDPDRLAHVSDLRHRQGLHDARARGGAAELDRLAHQRSREPLSMKPSS